MKHIHFIYGNQPFELDEEVAKLVHKLLPETNRQEAIFTFDIEDFFSKDQNQNRQLLSDLKNTCETVSFFSPVILVHLKNLQSLVVKKSKKEPLEKELDNISLVKIEVNNTSEWVDKDTLSDSPKTHFRLNGKQIVKHVKQISGNSYTVIFHDIWKDRTILQQSGNQYRKIPVSEFMSQKLGLEINVDSEVNPGDLTELDSNDLFSLIQGYLSNPPEQVELVVTACIKNTRELNAELNSLLSKNANQVKKTVSYDDFRPVSWILDKAKDKNLVMNKETADLLIELTGSDFSVLNMELEKLSVFLSPDRIVTPESIMVSVSQSKNFSVFRITDSLLKKDLKSALETLESLLIAHPGDNISIFALIATQFRKALKIAWMTEQGLTENMIIENLRINQWIAKQLIKQVENFTPRELENIIVHLAKCDIQLKYSAKDGSTILENICYLICQNDFQQNKTIKSKWLF